MTQAVIADSRGNIDKLKIGRLQEHGGVIDFELCEIADERFVHIKLELSEQVGMAEIGKRVDLVDGHSDIGRGLDHFQKFLKPGWTMLAFIRDVFAIQNFERVAEQMLD